MIHEEIIKRENGDQYLVRVSFYNESFLSSPARYTISVQRREKGQRKWRNSTEGDLTPGEIYVVKIELWNKMKPENPIY